MIWDREAYITEGQLSDTKFYKALDHDPTEEFNSQIESFIGELRHDGLITADMHKVLTTPKARTPEFYLLPNPQKDTPNPGQTYCLREWEPN